MSQVKLKKLVVHKIRNLKHVSLDFGVLTTIAGKLKCASVLPVVMQAIKFLCNRPDVHEKDLQYESGNREPDDGSLSFVEGQIIFPDGSQKTFRRSIDNNRSIFHIEEEEISEKAYQKEIEASEIVSAKSSATFVLSQANVDAAAKFTDKKRSEFIDFIATSEEVKENYVAVSKKLESYRFECDAARKAQAELTAGKKKLKSQIDADKNREQLNSEIEAHETQQDLFVLFHNQALFEAIEEELEELKKQAEEAREKVFEEENIQPCIENLQRLREDFFNVLNRIETEDRPKMVEFQLIYNQICPDEWKRQSIEEEEKLARLQRSTRARLLEKQIKELNDAIERRDFYLRMQHDENLLRCTAAYKSKFSFDEVESLRSKILSKYPRHDLSEKIEAPEDPEVEAARQERLKALEKELQENRELIAEYKSYFQRYSVIDIDYNKAAEEMTEYEQRREKHLDSRLAFNTLKQEFKESVVGRLSTLWNGVTPEAKAMLESRLGGFKNAIVVDTKETAESCIRHLEAKQMTSVDEFILPLSEVVNQKSTKDLLPGGKMPSGAECVFIESLIEAQSEDIEKLILRYGKPTLVTRTFDDMEKLLRDVSTRKLCILGKEEWQCSFAFGAMTTADRRDLEPLDTLEEVHRRFYDVQCEKLSLKHRMYRDHQRMKLLKERNKVLKALIKNLPSKTDPFDSDPDVIAFKTMYRAIEDELEEHYKEFIESINYPSYKEFIRHSKRPIERLRQMIELKTQQRDQLLAANEASVPTTADPAVAKAKKKMEKYEFEMMKSFIRIRDAGRNVFKVAQDIRTLQEQRADRIEILLKRNEDIYNIINDWKKALVKNYEILHKNYMKSNSKDLVEENFEAFMIVPDEVTDDYQVVAEQLGRARVKYEKLKKSLKKEINFTEKARELQTQIEKLRKRLANSGAKSRDEGSEQRLKTISSELTKVTKELEAQTAKLSEIAAHFRAIKESRKKCFKDAIAAINESLAEFCSLAFDNQIVSSLECANDEPYLYGVEFFWRTVENPDNRVNEINPNYAAALALLIGVAKLKNQRLLVLNNATQDTSCDFVKFLSNQKSLQAVLLSSKLSDEHTNYLIRSIGSSFAFTRMN